jgi:hypothetical protein
MDVEANGREETVRKGKRERSVSQPGRTGSQKKSWGKVKVDGLAGLTARSLNSA